MKDNDKKGTHADDELPGPDMRTAALERPEIVGERTEGQLREDQYRLIFENAGDAIFLMREGRFIECNRKAMEIFRCARNEIIGQPLHVFAPPVQPDGAESKATALEKMHSAMAGVPQLFEWRSCRHDGAPFDAEVSLNRVEIGGETIIRAVVRDITERKQAEKMLRESEELYRAVVENVGDGIAITAGTERVFVNKAFLAIHGLEDRSQALGLPLDHFIVPEDREAVDELVLLRQKGEPLQELIEYRILRSDGGTRTLQATVTLVNFKGRQAALTALRDVTSLKQAEAEIERLNEQLQRHVRELSQANVELQAFNSTVTHDLRIPLMAIDGFSRRLMEKYGHNLDEKGRLYLSMVQESVTRMGRLIDDLLAYSRLGKQDMQHSAVSMQELVASVVNELRTLYPDGEVLVSALPGCIGDERMLRQVVTNLLSNAFKFSKYRTHRIIEVKGWKEAHENVYSVKDNGAGFDMQYKDKLFRVFERLHTYEQFEGTGVGLSVVKRIVERHGGRIWAEGKPDAGATFYFSIPRPCP